MGKFNDTNSLARKLANDPTATKNHEGGLAFEMDAKTKLVTTVMASFIEGKFYQDKGSVMQELQKTVKAVLDFDPEFVLKLAVYARMEMNLRSVPLFLLNEFANSGKIVEGGRKYVSACIGRADEITELLSLSIKSRTSHPEKKFKSKKSSMFILKGLKPAFNKFDGYQFSKYKGEGNEVTLKDALLLVHPEPKDCTQQKLFDSIVNGTLAPPETWEVAISGNGSTKEAWEAIIPKMGYMALMRNLRNFIIKDVDLEPVITKLTDTYAISKAKQYPFRYYSAHMAVKEGSYDFEVAPRALTVMEALNKALETSLMNVPKIAGRSLVLVDVSGSMRWSNISRNSKVTPADIAGMFGAIASKVCDESDIIVFADRFGKVSFPEDESLLKRMDLISTVNVGGGTEAYLPVNFAVKNKQVYDRIFLFSDMQCYSTHSYGINSFAKSFVTYQREVNPAFLYSVDLTGYGTAQVPQDNEKVIMLSGFSEKLFEFVPAFESDKSTLVDAIEGYKV